MELEQAIKIFIDRGYINVENGIIFDGNKWREACERLTKAFEENELVVKKRDSVI